MYGSLEGDAKDHGGWLFFWLEAQMQLWWTSVVCSLAQAVSIKLTIFFFEETFYMLFAMSRKMTMHELKQLNRVVYKQNRFSGYVPPDQEDAINSADNDAEGPDLFGEPRDHLYKVTEQRIDG